jgi:hypothetical protein
MTILDIWNMWLMVSYACVAPPRLTATTAAPILPEKAWPLGNRDVRDIWTFEEKTLARLSRKTIHLR